MNKVTKGIVIGCGSILLLNIVALVVGVFYIKHAFKTALDPVSDLNQYTELKGIWQTNLVHHFPAMAPDEASFYYRPGFLQGGSAIQLKRTVPSTVMSNLWQRAMTNAVTVYHGGDWSDHANSTKGIPTTHFYTSGNDDLSFPPDYTIMVTTAVNLSGGFAWNHGQTAGFAISTQRNTVVYWAEDW